MSAHGIVKNATLFKGVVRAIFKIVLVNDADEPISNAKCKITFQDGQTIQVVSDGEGVTKFPWKVPGEFEIKLLEEEEANKESS